MNMDDVACVTALAAAVVSIAIGAVSVIGHTKAARQHTASTVSTAVAHECPQAHTSSLQIAPAAARAL
jgi:hypothetical protein